MKIHKPKIVKSKEEARQLAQDWQMFSGRRSMSYSEYAMWGNYFLELANRFNLTEEFKENGII